MFGSHIRGGDLGVILEVRGGWSLMTSQVLGDRLIFEVNDHRREIINIGRRSPAFPVTPPDVRVRTGRFGGLSYRLPVNLGISSESK